MSNLILPDRRFLLRSFALGAASFTAPGLFAQDLIRTAPQTEGPFYPNKLPLDTDNDLIIINDGKIVSLGEITHLTGRVLDLKGAPVRNALVEIWQCDFNGVYLHTDDSSTKKDIQDKNFQGFGRFLTNSSGEYYFRTIKPVPYKPRTPHIHVKIKKGGKDLFTTQLYIRGHEGNAKDGIYQAVRDPKARESITVDFTKIKGSKLGEYSAKFDIVLGITPEM